MKKSTLLSLVTAGAIVVTSAGTYAVWDDLNAESNTAEVTIDKAVSMSVSNLEFTPTPRTGFAVNASDLAQTTSITVDVKDVPTTVASGHMLKYTPVVEEGDASEIDVAVEDPKAEELTGGATDKHTATVTVTPKESANNDGGIYKIKVEVSIVPNPAP